LITITDVYYYYTRLTARCPGQVIVDDKGIKDCWKEYMEKLMNEENE